MHATVIGLEKRRGDGLENRNFHALKARAKVMRLPALFEFMLNCKYFPFHAQIGGFQDRDYPFQSRGARPYRRSFSLQENIPVVMGWPIGVERCGGDQLTSRTALQSYPTNLEDLRRRAQRFNVLHRWHRRSTDVDNDLYIRLGIFEGELSDSRREALEDEIRRALSALPPLIVKLAVSDLAVVSYPADDETLPEMRSEAVPLTDPRLLDEDFVAGLYIEPSDLTSAAAFQAGRG
jgi:hypothetical protein